MLKKIITKSENETFLAGAKFAENLRPGDVVLLDGDLGAGKTVFARGALSVLAPGYEVLSPTYTLIHEYETPVCRAAHMDIYRITGADALYDIGFYDYDDGDRIILIEWARNAYDALDAVGTYSVTIEPNGDDGYQRLITIKGL